mgnify:CR=1 FL=1
MFDNTRSKLLAAGAVASAFVATNANAAIDVTAAVAEIDGAHAPIALLGGAALIVAVIIKVYRRLRGAA